MASAGGSGPSTRPTSEDHLEKQDRLAAREHRPDCQALLSTNSEITATLPKIAPGDLAEFKQLAAQLLERTKGEAGALRYDWFLNADETKCVVRETYENFDAVLAHMANVGELLGKLAELGGGLEIEGFGPASPQLAEAAAAMHPALYGFFQGK